MAEKSTARVREWREKNHGRMITVYLTHYGERALQRIVWAWEGESIKNIVNAALEHLERASKKGFSYAQVRNGGREVMGCKQQDVSALKGRISDLESKLETANQVIELFTQWVKASPEARKEFEAEALAPFLPVEADK